MGDSIKQSQNFTFSSLGKKFHSTTMNKLLLGLLAFALVSQSCINAASTTKSPAPMTDKPVTTTKAPLTTSDAPATNTKAQGTTPDLPATSTEAPVTTTKYIFQKVRGKSTN